MGRRALVRWGDVCAEHSAHSELRRAGAAPRSCRARTCVSTLSARRHRYTERDRRLMEPKKPKKAIHNENEEEAPQAHAAVACVGYRCLRFCRSAPFHVHPVRLVVGKLLQLSTISPTLPAQRSRRFASVCSTSRVEPAALDPRESVSPIGGFPAEPFHVNNRQRLTIHCALVTCPSHRVCVHRSPFCH